MSVQSDHEWRLERMFEELDRAIVKMNAAVSVYRNVSEDIGKLCRIDLRYYDVGAITCDDPMNPVGRCIYHAFNDSAHDNCRYCNLPEERK